MGDYLPTVLRLAVLLHRWGVGILAPVMGLMEHEEMLILKHVVDMVIVDLYVEELLTMVDMGMLDRIVEEMQTLLQHMNLDIVDLLMDLQRLEPQRDGWMVDEGVVALIVFEAMGLALLLERLLLSGVWMDLGLMVMVASEDRG
jgi:hypothetical protein